MVLRSDSCITFGDVDGPCALTTVLSVGRQGIEENKKHSAALAKLAKESLGIDPTRCVFYYVFAYTFMNPSDDYKVQGDSSQGIVSRNA